VQIELVAVLLVLAFTAGLGTGTWLALRHLGIDPGDL
jgi:hypothetical protein